MEAAPEPGSLAERDAPPVERRVDSELSSVGQNIEMGRKSKLTDAQWANLGERLMGGEAPADLSKEYGVSQAAISKKFSKTKIDVKGAAHTLARGQLMVNALPPTQRRQATLLADKLVGISESMADGAEYAAATFRGLKAMANSHFLKIDPVNPVSDADSLLAFKTLAALTDLANKVAITPMNLLAANREAFRHGDNEGPGVIRIVNDPDS